MLLILCICLFVCLWPREDTIADGDDQKYYYYYYYSTVHYLTQGTAMMMVFSLSLSLSLLREMLNGGGRGRCMYY